MFSPNVFRSISSSASVSRFPRPNCSTWQPIFPPVWQVPAHQVSRVSVDYRLYADHMRKATIYNSSDFWLQGCKIKMDDSGNILVKRIAKSNVYVKSSVTVTSQKLWRHHHYKQPPQYVFAGALLGPECQFSWLWTFSQLESLLQNASL